MDWAKKRKMYELVLFAAGCILINSLGKDLAERFSLPLWLDAFGTIVSAYVLGPVWGCVVGVAGNLIYGILNPVSYIYALTSLAIAISVGILARFRFFDSFFKTLSISVFVAGISTVISVICNVIFYKGMTGNMWGDGVINFLKEQSFPNVICYMVGEFYIDFLDKVIAFLLIMGLLHFARRLRDSAKRKTKGSAKIGMLLVLSLSIGLFQASPAYAEKTATGDVAEEVTEEADGEVSVETTEEADGGITGETVGIEDSVDEEARSNTSYISTIYNGSNGLPCGTANDIVQTEDGILWIGTYAGLYRYNGTEIRLEDEYSSIKNVNCLYVDDENRLWIGTNDNGFSVSVNEKISNVMDTTDGLSADSVRCIVQSSDDSYYIGTTGYMQVVSLDEELGLTATIEEVSYAVCATADEEGHVAAIDTNGILYLMKDGRVLASLELGEGQEIFTECDFDEEGILYVGTSLNHIYAYDVSDNEFTETNIYTCGELQAINDIYFSDEGGAFICADNGVGYMDAQRKYTDVSTGQFNNSIDNMTIDFQGNLWFVSSRQGLLRLCESNVFDYYEELGVEKKVVNTSEFWNDLLYVGTDTGLDVLDLENGKVIENELTESLAGIRIRCIKADSRNHLWICTYGNGLWEVDKDSVKTYDTQNGKFGDRARAVLEMTDGTIVAAGDNGISFINDGEVASSFLYGSGLSNAMILSLMEMSDGGLMAGTDGDGIVIIKDGAVAKTITRDDGLSSNVILRTVADSAGDGTFVVTSNGLCYIFADYTVTTLDNFPYFNNYDIWESADGELFVLSSAGIYIVDRDELMSGEELSYTLLDAQTGLSATLTVNSWNVCVNGEYLYLSCDTGVYGVDMLDIALQDGVYKMKLASVELDYDACEVDEASTLEIGRDVTRIEIFPEVVNYKTEKPYVIYWLEGFEKTHTVVPLDELGSVVYTNVPSGSYTFHLGIADSDKETVLEEVTYSFVKVKEIYDNEWFIFYMIFVLALFVSWLTWFIVRTQIQGLLNFQKKELEYAKNEIEMGNQTILAIARTVDAKDERTSLHSQRVADYSVLIAREIGKTDEECELLRKIALLHDIGKIGIPDSVLNKPGKLTEEEYEMMKSHVSKGAEILKDFTVVDHVWEGALYHHERYDGKGYINGLKGEEIPLNARIIGIADAFDAMTANRVYRKKLDFDRVLEELKKGRGTQFDPKLVDILLELIEAKKIDVDELYSL